MSEVDPRTVKQQIAKLLEEKDTKIEELENVLEQVKEQLEKSAESKTRKAAELKAAMSGLLQKDAELDALEKEALKLIINRLR